MPDVFISYSRKDREFVRRLQVALTERGRDAYVDVEDIPAASRWRQEIAEAIEGADSLVFVVSPDSVASPECQKELDHAVTHHKRIIPLVYRETETRAAPEALKEIHWIYCREQDDFAAAISTLIKALDTDLDWVKAHTRLLTRAGEWNRKSKDKSLLVRGSDLKEAEACLAQSGTKEPKPTDLQRQYVLASRQGEIKETRRKRRLLAGLLMGVVLLAIAAPVAVYQYRLSLSRHLAAQAQNLLEGQYIDLPLLLSVEACRAHKTQEAEEALVSALQKEPRLKTMFHQNYVQGMAFSPDGKTLISASGYNFTFFWDLKTRQALGPPLKGEGILLERKAFDQKSTIQASSDGGLITLWGLENRKVLTQIKAIKDWTGAWRYWDKGHKPFKTGSNVVLSLAISPDGRVLAAGTRDAAILLWDLKTYQALGQPLLGHKDFIISLAFSPDGNILASGSRDDDTIILWDLRTQKPLGPPLTGHKNAVTSLVFSPDGRTLASGSADQAIILWDVNTRKPLRSPLTGHKNGVTSLAYSPDGQTLASGSADKTIILWDLQTSEPLDIPLALHKDGVRNVAFSPDGKTLASGSGDGTIILWDTRLRKGSGAAFRGHRDEINSVAFSPDGTILASASDDRTVIFWDAKTREPLGPPLEGHKGPVNSVAFSPDGNILATGGRDDDYTILLWNARSRKPLQPPLRGHRNWIDCLAFSPDGKTLASGGADETIILWDVETHKPLGPPLRGHEENVFSVAFSPDGRILASGGYDEVIILWDLETRQPLGPPLEGHKGPVNSVAFSPDGRTLASASNDSTIIIWDMQTRKPLGPFLKEQDVVESIAYSPDGAMLAAASADRTLNANSAANVTLWDLETRQPLGPRLKVPDWRVKSVAFSPDGQTLAAGSWTKGAIMFWDVKTRQPLGLPLISEERDAPKGIGESDLKEYFERACRIANRNLTREEWRQYLGAYLPYQKTCPDCRVPKNKEQTRFPD